MGLATAVDDDALAAADLRDRASERASLRPLLEPATVAVVGAGRQTGRPDLPPVRVSSDGTRCIHSSMRLGSASGAAKALVLGVTNA